MSYRGSAKQLFIRKIVEAGRLRWKIENEGFNTQKNQGCHLLHKFSEKSIDALHVYYILLQMAHLVNEIIEHSKPVVALLKRSPKLTIKYLWDRLRHFSEDHPLDYALLKPGEKRCQIRLASHLRQLE